MIQNELLTYSGTDVVFIGVLILLISGKPSEKKRQIYEDSPFGGIQGYIVKPFRIQRKGTVACTFSNIAGSERFRIFLTDLFAGLDIDYTWGPRYFEITEHGEQKVLVDIGSGEYALVIDNRNLDVSGKFSIEFSHKEYPLEKFAAWGLALIEVGASMSLVGIAL